MATRDSNTQAVPGVPLNESDFEDGGGHHEHGPDADDEDRGGRGGGVLGLADRVLSRTTSKSSFNPGPPPDGGLKAWTAVAAGHLVIMNTWGYINSFGVFQTYYATELGLPPATISWIGSIQVFLLFFIGTFTGRITDAGVSDTSGLHPLRATSAGLLFGQLSLQQGWVGFSVQNMSLLIFIRPKYKKRLTRGFLVLPRGIPPRNFLPAARHLHHVGLHQVLAAVPGPGRVHGPRQRLPLLPHGGDRVDVLHQEEGPRHRHDGLRERDGRADLPRDGEAAAAHGGVPLDHQGDWLHPGCEPGGRQHRAEAQDPAEEGRGAGGVGCFQ